MTKNRVISFHYTLKDPEGVTLDSSVGDEPLTFLEGVGQIIPGLENAMKSLAKGDKKIIEVETAQAYGHRNDQLVVSVDKAKLPKQDVQVGDQFQTQDPNSPPFTVVEVTDTQVILDANHPLAGLDLTFDVEITEIRDATEEEMTHGHAHGPGGHHH